MKQHYFFERTRNDRIIEEIHSSEVFGIFLETGAGLPVTQALSAHPGVEQTIYFAESPINPRYSREKYGPSPNRAASRSAVLQLLSHQVDTHCKNNEDCNLVFVSGFQLFTDGENISRGWIAVYFKGETRLFYLTIPGNDRKELIDAVGEAGVQLLKYAIDDEQPQFNRGTWEQVSVAAKQRAAI